MGVARLSTVRFLHPAWSHDPLGGFYKLRPGDNLPERIGLRSDKRHRSHLEGRDAIPSDAGSRYAA